jgi:hypothetical protein
MFKAGDYIVCLEGEFTTSKGYVSNVGKVNFVVKQYTNSTHLQIKTGIHDKKGFKNNVEFKFDRSSKLKNWRYATKEEAEEYEKLGGPYNVTLLKIKTKTTQNNYNYLIPIIKQLNKLCIKEKKEELQVE